VSANPFAVLGLPADPSLSDEQVRTAWRSIATATHPDRDDGGDPARYVAASAAYAVLRIPWRRSEAYADLMGQAPSGGPSVGRASSPGRWLSRRALLVPARVRHGRPVRLLLRVLAAVALAVIAVGSGAGGPAAAGVLAGLGIWLALTARGDLAPPPGR
jgi:hypothetical protein